MDCPTCGLLNPPSAQRCDCGYDFEAQKPSGTPGWEIEPAWRHKLAAFWAISWPAMVCAFLLMAVLTGGQPPALARWFGSLLPLAIEVLLTRRLVRKNFRSFRIYVLRAGGQLSRNLTFRESLPVAFWVVWPQLVVELALSLVFWLLQPHLTRDAVQQLVSVSIWLRFLAVGPYAVGLALRVHHPSFRLKTFGYRYV